MRILAIHKLKSRGRFRIKSQKNLEKSIFMGHNICISMLIRVPETKRKILRAAPFLDKKYCLLSNQLTLYLPWSITNLQLTGMVRRAVGWMWCSICSLLPPVYYSSHLPKSYLAWHLNSLFQWLLLNLSYPRLKNLIQPFIHHMVKAPYNEEPYIPMESVKPLWMTGF